MSLTLKPSQLGYAIETLIKAKRPGIVQSGPGVGKSSIFKQTAARLGMKFVDIRAVLLDPVDLRGLPYVENGKSRWAPPDFLPTQGPALVLIDEINAAPSLVQAGLYSYILDGHLGEHIKPEDVYVFGAGNRDSDGAVTTRMGTALRSRFAQLELEPDLDDWRQWAVGADIDVSVLAFMNWRSELLYKFDKTQKAFPCPRTWEFVSDVMKVKATSAEVERALIYGYVGEGAGIEFISFLKLYRNLPSIDSILMNPEKVPVPTQPSEKYAVATALALKASDQNIATIMKYLDRMEPEYNVLSMKTALMKSPAIERTKTFVSWAVRFKDALGVR